MALSTGQITMGSAVGVHFGDLQPGCAVTMTMITATATAYVGQVGGTLLTSANGYPIMTGQAPVTWSLPPTSQPTSLFAIGAGTCTMAYAFQSNT